MKHIAAVWARAGAAAALVAGIALFGAPTAALAADPLPDLMVSFDQEKPGEVDNSGKTVGVYVYNYGEAVATAVTLTVDLSKVSDAVEYSVPEWAEQCKLAGTAITCTIGQLDIGQVDTIQPLTLVSKTGATPGDAGTVTVSIDGAEEDAWPATNSESFPVTVLTSGPDLVALAADLNSKSDRVGPGDTAPLYTAVVNEGDTATSSIAFTVDVPTGATFAERYSDCTYTDYWPDDIGKGYIYGPDTVTCSAPLELQPGEYLLLFDEETGDSLFNVTFGKNLSGPEEHTGAFSVALGDEVLAAKNVAKVKGTGKSFADAARKFQAAGEKAGLASQRAAIRAQELDESDNYANFAVFSKANKLDVAVSAPAIQGAVGDTVDLTYEIVNNGPSDGGGPGALITAPTGTVLLPAEWCYTAGTENEQKPESAKLECHFESFFPTTASGHGKVRATVQVKIKSTPGTDGTIVVDGATSAKEYKPANNTAKIVINAGSDGGTGGGDPGLPITGAPAALVAGAGGAALAIGVAVLMMFRRRRIVLQTPQD